MTTRRVWQRGLLALCLALVLCPGAPSARAAGAARLAVVTGPGTAQYVAAAKFKELCEARLGGGLAVEILHSGAAGSETGILRDLAAGGLNLAIVTSGPFQSLAPEAAVVDFPFLFRDHAEADRILDGPLGREVLDALEPAGIKGLCFAENGFRHLTNNRRPVRCAADVAGLRIRVMEARLHVELWRLLGAIPMPLPWPVDREIARGLVDGQENPLSVIAVAGLAKVQKHLSLTGHVYSAHICAANLAWFSALPEKTRQAVGQAMRDAAAFERALSRKNEAAFLAELKARGMLVVERPDWASFWAKAAGARGLKSFSGPKVRALLERFLAAARD